MRVLYDHLASGQVSTDQDALEKIDSLQHSASILATIKSKLKDRLNEALLLIDFNDADSNYRQKVYLDCIKKWASIHILLSRNYRELGLQRMEQLLRYTRKFEFTELTIEILYMLRLQNGLIYGREQQYCEFDALLKHYIEVRTAEELAETLYADMMINYVNIKSDKLEIAQQATILYEQIEPRLKVLDSYRLHLFGRLLQISIYDNRNDYHKLIALCEDAISFFDQKPYKSFNALQVFYYSLLVGYLNLRQYERCRTVATRYVELFKEGSYNWFKWVEMYFFAEFHAGNFEKAEEIWYKAVNRPEYPDLPPYIAEAWKIFEAYFLLLSRAGRLKSKRDIKKSRLGKIWNEIHVSNRDKSGMNIPILVAQFLLSLADREYGQCIDRQEGLAKYRTRYLKPDNAARSHYFFKMLELIPKFNFDLALVRANAAPYLAKICAIPLEAANQNFEVEVIPYEILWNIVLSLLQNKTSVSLPAELTRPQVH